MLPLQPPTRGVGGDPLAAAPCPPADLLLSTTSVYPTCLYRTVQKLYSFSHLDGILTFGNPSGCVEHLALLWFGPFWICTEHGSVCPCFKRLYRRQSPWFLQVFHPFSCPFYVSSSSYFIFFFHAVPFQRYFLPSSL